MFPSFKQYLVEEEREVYFTFGRMNPPTIGHGKLMNVMSAKAGKNPYKIYLSSSQDAKKNPLSYEQKIKHARKMFPKHARNIILNKKLRNVFDVAVALYDQGFNKINMVVGADRITEFKTLLEKYNGVKARHGFYNFEKINIVSAGERDPDADDVTGMSASKQRKNAENNDFSLFSQGVPKSMSNQDTKRLFNDVRTGMGLKESKSFKNHIELEPVSDIREKYIEGQLFNEDDQVKIKATGEMGRVFRLGTNYVIVELEEGRVSRQWLDSVELVNEVMKTDDGTPEATRKMKKKVPGQEKAPVVEHESIELDEKSFRTWAQSFARLRSKTIDKDKYTKVARYVKQEMDKAKSKKTPEHHASEVIRKFNLKGFDTHAIVDVMKDLKLVKEQQTDDEVKQARRKIDQELLVTKKRHDRILDRARLARARRKNREDETYK
jgi:hypothetical protein